MQRLSRRDFLALGAAGLLLPSLARAQNPQTFTIATLNDIHAREADSIALLDRAVARINSDARVRFVAVLGDVATSAQRSEFELASQSLKGLKVPLHAVPGNHDVLLKGSDPCAEYSRSFGAPRWKFEENGWTFIGLNTCDGVKSDVSLMTAEMDWLKTQVTAVADSSPIALFCHHPLNPNARKYRVANADDVLAIFKGKRLRLVASGHWHGNQVERADGVLFTTTACCTSTRNNFDDTKEKGYRLFHLGADSVETEFVVVE